MIGYGTAFTRRPPEPYPGGELVHVVTGRARLEGQQAEPPACSRSYQANDLLFQREDGSPVHPELFSHASLMLVRDSGVSCVRLDDPRHANATIPLRVGVPVIQSRSLSSRSHP